MTTSKPTITYYDNGKPVRTVQVKLIHNTTAGDSQTLLIQGKKVVKHDNG